MHLHHTKLRQTFELMCAILKKPRILKVILLEGVCLTSKPFTVPVCMVATGQLALHVATFAELATRALKYTIYSNFGACSPTGPKFRPKYSVMCGN